ncbi:MAG: glycoside hydrolase family 43 protein [Lachnospiraceae bacterium]|nr:glycoside hydrolase family 43 protein [Lachnospiraceae bacterium]
MKAVRIGNRREVCWDEFLLEEAKGIQVQMHRPEFRNVALECDAPWEGNVCGYFTLIPDETQFRLYYRGDQLDVDNDGVCKPSHKTMYCYAESKDGKTFHRVPVNEISFWGRKDNNIISDGVRDNMYVFRDSNPSCPPDARYKGLAEADDVLWYYKSQDGMHFTKERVLADDGAYDSLNVIFWDEETEQYFFFYRGLHGENAPKGKWSGKEWRSMHTTIIRDVRVRTSKDFENWSEPRLIQFDPEREDTELYTNQIQKYYRARHMFLGFPTRYVDRYQDAQNFNHLPDWKHRQKLIRNWGRSGTAMTDAMIMTSRDGFTFRRTEEAFLTPGIERTCNWYYGDCYLCYGMAETASDIPGAPREISLYMGQDYRVNPVKLCRYAIRLDGFFSWHCDYEPGKAVTKPLIFAGNSLEINFATSAAGYVQIRLLDGEGNFLEGYDSGRLFGDSVDRAVDFQKPLAELAGKEIRMEVSMRDGELYAFQFTEMPAIC